MIQEKNEKIKEIIEEDIWGTIKQFLDQGIHFGEGEKSIHITIGLLLLLTVAFLITSTLLQAIRKFFTRKMEVI